MKKILLMCSLLLFGSAQAQHTMPGPSFFFDNNSATMINPELFSSYYRDIAHKVTHVDIWCFTDTDGSQELNKELVQARCKVVSDYLNELGYGNNATINGITFLNPKDNNGNVVVQEKATSLKNLYGRKALNRQVMVFLTLKREVPQIVKVPVVQEVVKAPKHRTQIYAGFAPDGVRDPLNNGGNLFSVQEDRDMEMGFSYTYSFSRHFNVSGLVLTNRSYFLGIGKDW